MSARRRQRPDVPVARLAPPRRWPWVWLAVMVLTVAAVLSAERTGHGRSVVSGVREFLVMYAGVFALVGLTAAVGVGLIATDRIVMKPGHRIVAQAMHRGVSLAALVVLAAHIGLEITAHRARAIDTAVPFLALHRPLYIGLGTMASDLVVLIAVTGFMRGRFAARWPWAWRAIHAVAYLCWPLAIVHGLFGGRSAQPYVDWSYGACLALVALALAIRFVTTTRSAEEKLAHPVPDRLSLPTEDLVPGSRVTMTPLGSAAPGQRALPSGRAGGYRAAGFTGSGGYAGAVGRGALGGAARPAHSAAAEPTDSGSWTVPPDLSRPGRWAPPPDPAEGRAWAASHDLTDPGTWMAPPELTQPGGWVPPQAPSAASEAGRYGPPDPADGPDPVASRGRAGPAQPDPDWLSEPPAPAGHDWRYGPPEPGWRYGPPEPDWPTDPGIGAWHAAPPDPAEAAYPPPADRWSGQGRPSWPPSPDWPPGYASAPDGTPR